MQIHLPMNLKTENNCPMLPKTRASKNISHRSISISCSAREWAVGKGKKPDFYEILSLRSKKVGLDEIKKAYRAMALQYHPDLCPPSAKEESIKRFIELKKAYETLSDPISRRIYDYERLGFSGFCIEQRKPCFAKEVWERQLAGLRKRSYERIERNKYKMDVAS